MESCALNRSRSASTPPSIRMGMSTSTRGTQSVSLVSFNDLSLFGQFISLVG